MFRQSAIYIIEEGTGMERKRVFSLLVDNTSSVLSRVSGLFTRRGYNIHSIAAGTTMDPRFTRITVVVDGDDQILEQIEKQLNKKIDIIKVNTFEEMQSISRELMLLKVKYNKGNRKDIMENCEIMNAQIVDISKTHMIIQVCDVPERTQLFIKMLQGISIVEVARTGTVALKKCCETK